jgi:hypothetical protein
VLCTNTRLTPLQAALRYRERWIEDIFRTAKALLATRPIFPAQGTRGSPRRRRAPRRHAKSSAENPAAVDEGEERAEDVAADRLVELVGANARTVSSNALI